MDHDTKRALKDIEWFHDEVCRAAKEARSAVEAVPLRSAWDRLITNHDIVCARAIHLAKLVPSAAQWGDALYKRRGQNGDPGLRYLREARNAPFHGLPLFAEFQNERVSIGGHFGLTDSSITFENVRFSGPGFDVLVPSAVAEATGGKLSKSTLPLGTPVVHMAADLVLQPVRNPKNEEFAPPTSVDGIRVNPLSPRSLATAMEETARRYFREIKQLCR